MDTVRHVFRDIRHGSISIEESTALADQLKAIRNIRFLLHA